MSILPEKQRACLKQDPVARAILPLGQTGMLPPSNMKIKRNPFCKAACSLTKQLLPTMGPEVKEVKLL